ncbi:GGDEF domain-containing protein [Candidatus Weimeria sp. HCP3S3_B5]|uniref:GGDEF domain-containing protein n=1 Tax=Candidatus Weimeria sp. HCP3S3_B5 TaxID=3438871 RepID=UPI003F89DD41
MMKEGKREHTVLVLTVTVLFNMLIIMLSGISALGRTELDKGWRVIFHQRTFNDVDLNSFRLPYKVSRGDRVILEREIPVDIGSDKALAFRTSLSNVTVYINRRVSYMYMNNIAAGEKTPGSGMNAVVLPDNARGGECQVIITAGNDHAFNRLPAFYIVDAWNGSAIQLNLSPAVSLIGFFLTSLGVIVLCLSFVMIFFGIAAPERVFVTGLMAFLIGIWSLYSSNVFELFSSDFTMNTRIGILCLYASVIPFDSLIVMVRGARRRKRWLLAVGIMAPIVFIIVAAVLDIRGKIFVSGLYWLNMLVSAISIIITISSTGKKYERKNNRVFSLGIDVMTAGIIIDIIRYLIVNSIRIRLFGLERSLIPFFALAYVIIILYSYMVDIGELYLEQSGDAILKELAYTDPLTGLLNRASYNLLVKNLTGGKRVYTMISLDVNGLKIVNDIMGHEAGDMLIKDSASVLSAIFKETDKVIRMGGDEFLVISEKKSRGRLASKLRRMEKLLTIRSRKRPYDISISYGIASSDEDLTSSADNVYRLADQRMYEMKKQMKKERGSL